MARVTAAAIKSVTEKESLVARSRRPCHPWRDHHGEFYHARRRRPL